ncbi:MULTISPECIES: ABC transporter ATP-binding protein [unclassified Methanoregula]|uniref:ABC transporter ATP-binding protein n=1 Tax=unclassified Methanoregula TaxID=2649730 RepID=UPI0009CF4B33|nr:MULTISPECIES: ATP-binding cassette domain-containing protein [unclassified Methanoregula]OPX62016.1 MAG: Trehalose/maltose import ATP-binding protein MalK [Methanoregula sp. PtaB.Bin085]OPY34309.1 MAG: Trehalose/maltose import ATP-binding protein MalK [Methanoregula sp. PtaU1.Bin006]
MESSMIQFRTGTTLADHTAPEITGPAGPIIHIEHITKIFGDRVKTVTAVDDISFDVNRGEIFGLLGPNGAGKSTLIRILTTLLRPTNGKAYVDRYEVTASPEKIRSIIGVCPQNSTLDVELTAYDNLAFYGKLVDVPDERLDTRIWELLEMTGLAERAHTRVATFSGGMRRKLEIVRAFIHHPLILFLDEPTIGLDPEARREVWQQIATLNREKTTIILTTHYMDEAEKLCDRIAFVDKGRLISLDTTDNLRKQIPAGDLIEIGTDTMNDAVLEEIRGTGMIISVSFRGGILHISAKNGSTVLPIIVSVLERHSIVMKSIAIRRPSLEDVFIYLTGKNLDDGNTTATVSGQRGNRK